MDDQSNGKSANYFRIIGFVCVGVGVLLLANFFGRLLSFDIIADYWPGLLVVLGIAMAMISPKQATAGIIMALGGLLVIFTRHGLLSSSIGQLLIAVFAILVGVLLITKLTRPQ